MRAKIRAAAAGAWRWLRVCYRFCEHCGAFFGVRLIGAMTQYYWNGKGEDPNRPLVLCRACADEYTAHWKEMWADYNAMIYEGIFG